MKTTTDYVRSVLNSNEFRQAYHRAVDRVNKTSEVQQPLARKFIERYFCLGVISPTTPLDSDSFYFLGKPIEVGGRYKFLVSGAVKRELVPGLLFLLTPKTASVERLVDAKTFDNAIRAVEAVRLTLLPERVNGIISFIADAKNFNANNDIAGAEKAIDTALGHLNRAASEGLQKIKTDAERGKRSNEVVGTQRTLTDLRKKLQSERILRAATRRSDERSLGTPHLQSDERTTKRN